MAISFLSFTQHAIWAPRFSRISHPFLDIVSLSRATRFPTQEDKAHSQCNVREQNVVLDYHVLHSQFCRPSTTDGLLIHFTALEWWITRQCDCPTRHSLSVSILNWCKFVGAIPNSHSRTATMSRMHRTSLSTCPNRTRCCAYVTRGLREYINVH